MQGATRRRTLARTGVVAGSVWEARMRVDAVNGGVKVFNADGGDGDGDEEGMRVYRRLRRNQSDSIASSRKRRNWTAPQVEGRSPIQLRKSREAKVLAIGEGGEGTSDGDGASVDIGIEDDGMKSFDDKEMDLPAEKGNSVEEEEKTISPVHEIPVLSPAIDKNHDSLVPLPDVEQRKQLNNWATDPDTADPPAPKLGKKLNRTLILPSLDAEKKMMNHRAIDPDPVETNPYAGKKMNRTTVNPDPVHTPSLDGAREMQEATPKNNHNRLQSIVDLLMWRDVPKTALVFGLGTFILVSSSYARDLNFSLISATSYLGLIFLALIFFCKSILRRGELEYDERDERYMVGEEDAIWILRLLLPYLNEVLFKMRALFSGDPATTMKMAVLLFAMAKCGSSITIWTMSKLIFFGVFTVPKICTSYSTQLLKFGKFWVARFRDGWESCTHKKAVTAAVFTLIWNISSTATRIWAVFMLVVALKLYQQRLSEDWGNQEGEVVVENLAMAQEAAPKPGRPQYKGAPRRNEAMGENKPKKRI
ncbi:reticulon-like protein B21 isoform X2 [Zingiber officinale]|uniref:reticulon-like protein B21 isoform X2 n=1 Tax=Zingiber officinale TaxID=94328 RepID=UPI001C4CB9FF|nr:reticulon-like protein B21 isoform X2 [Zingiber officinale]